MTQFLCCVAFEYSTAGYVRMQCSQLFWNGTRKELLTAVLQSVL